MMCVGGGEDLFIGRILTLVMKLFVGAGIFVYERQRKGGMDGNIGRKELDIIWIHGYL